MNEELIDRLCWWKENCDRTNVGCQCKHVLEHTIQILQKYEELDKDNKVLKRLLNGEWVDTDEVEKALGITFADGYKRFDFSRTADWWSIIGTTNEERAREGQKITTRFRLKNCSQGART